MKIIFFSPHAFIGVHAIPEALVANSIIKLGHEVIYIGCDRAYKNNCVSMSAAGVGFFSTEQQKNKVCNECLSKKNAIISTFKFTSININDFMYEEDLNIIQNDIKNLNKSNWFEYLYEDMPVGRYSAFELILGSKINKLTLSDNEFLVYKDSLISSLKTLFAAKRIFNIYQPDKVVVYNSFYSLNNIFCSLANKLGIDFYTLHAGSHLKDRLSLMTVFKGSLSASLVSRSNAWTIYRDSLLTKQKILKVHSHIKELFKARSPWVYSIKASGLSQDHIKKILGIPKDKKIILATLSSLDENFAGSLVDAIAPYDKPIFETQNEWIDFLIKYASTNRSIFMIIRPHPREYPNKRENILSQRSKELQEKFSKLPSNVVINYPSHNIAFHDLLRVVDLGLNTTSTTGIEFIFHNIPVINCDSGRVLAYPNELHIVAEDIDDYIYKINCTSKYNVKNQYLLVYKWLSFLFEVVQIDIQDAFRMNDPNFVLKILLYIKRKLGFKNFLYGLDKSKNIDNLYNQKWLAYAILNNKESCLEERVRYQINGPSAISDIDAERYIGKLLQSLIK